ncbi:sulfotransferase family protein [Halioxenophilus aromaticivorans]|uniref:Sulfotransferase n=1 Tax=Halioxenophilus aromaticivorans TaxID=1306992 RepID=A0AAV3U1L0_9ALTE
MIGQLDKTYLTYSKRSVAHRLVSYFLFEGRPHTTKGQWINPFVNAFLRTLALVPGEPIPDRPIYITGLGRSGTTILGKVLSLHEQVGFLNEPKMMWAIADPKTDVCGDYVQQGGRFLLSGSDVPEGAPSKVQRILARYASLTGVERPLDKYPEFIFRVDYLKQVLPNAKVVFISRNGCDAVASVAHWSQDKGVNVGERTDDWWGRGDVKWTYLCEQIISQQPEYAAVANVDLKTMDHTNRAALEWIITMRQGLVAKAQMPDDIYHIKYEELVKAPKEQMIRLLEACELPMSDDVLTYAKDVLYDRPRKDKPELMPDISKLFDETMSQLGY